MTFSNPIDLTAPENYPAVRSLDVFKNDAAAAMHSIPPRDEYSVTKTELYRQLGCMPELALEAHDLLRGEHGGEIPGVSLTEETDPFVTVHTVKILNEQGSRIMQKPTGTYVTIFTEALQINHHGVHQTLANTVAQHLAPFVAHLHEDDCVLVAGLGNWNATPDALGPRVVKQIMATRHLHGNVPDEVLEGVRPVAAIAPGVLGMTGVESAEMIAGVVRAIEPKLLIVIDALAAGNTERIGTTIQICNTGIEPGAGVANPRSGINEASLGIPVIAIGIPTVVKARLIAHQVLESYQSLLSEHLQDRRLPYYAAQAMEQALAQCHPGLEVTPKEIDDIVDNCVVILSKAITQALHPNMNADFAESFF